MARKSIEDDPEWQRLRKAEDDAWFSYVDSKTYLTTRGYRSAVETTEAYEREWKP